MPIQFFPRGSFEFVRSLLCPLPPTLSSRKHHSTTMLYDLIRRIFEKASVCRFLVMPQVASLGFLAVFDQSDHWQQIYKCHDFLWISRGRQKLFSICLSQMLIEQEWTEKEFCCAARCIFCGIQMIIISRGDALEVLSFSDEPLDFLSLCPSSFCPRGSFEFVRSLECPLPPVGRQRCPRGYITVRPCSMI